MRYSKKVVGEIQEGIISQGIVAASRCKKYQGNEFSPRVNKRASGVNDIILES
jgi:hypothetical protein